MFQTAILPLVLPGSLMLLSLCCVILDMQLVVRPPSI
jgi:hypothetical protein